MEPLDQHIADALNDEVAARRGEASAEAGGPGRMLIVMADAALRRDMIAALQRHAHQCIEAGSVSEARAAIARGRFDLVITCRQFADGSGLDLAPLVQKVSPSTKIIVLTPGLTADFAVQAMRCGAVDCLGLPLNMDELARRVEPALLRSRAERQRDERLLRLKKVCRELNIARHEISRQVDSLCDDLHNAYREIADQMSDVALASEFRTLLKQELDVEDLLRTTLEYLLTKTGATNAAVFLPEGPPPRPGGEARSYGLGAYVNYDCPRETISLLLDHLGKAICPQMEREPEIVSFIDSREFAEWVGIDTGFLAQSHVVAFACRHEGECLAVFVLFRSQQTPYDEKLAATFDTMREIIAEQLSNVIRIHQRAKPSWPKEAEDGDMDYHDDDMGFGGYEGGLAA